MRELYGTDLFLGQCFYCLLLFLLEYVQSSLVCFGIFVTREYLHKLAHVLTHIDYLN